MLVGERVRGRGRGLGIAFYTEAGGFFWCFLGSKIGPKKGTSKRFQNGPQMGHQEVTPEQKKGSKSGVQKSIPQQDPFGELDGCDFAAIYYTSARSGLSEKGPF